MVIRYRTEDLTRWGPGVGVDLQAAWIDENFWDLVTRVQTLEALPPPAAAISHFIVEGDQWTVVFEDYTTIGPYTLPTVPLVFRGEWLPSTHYFVNEMFQYGGAIYVVQVEHTSQPTFDPGYAIGTEDVYGFGLQVDGVLPSGGAAGMWLQKSSATDFDVSWVTAPIPAEGTTGQVLAKVSDTDYDSGWIDLVYSLSDAEDVAAGTPPYGSILRYRAGTYQKEQDNPPQLLAASVLTLSVVHAHRFNLMTSASGCEITVPPAASWSTDTLFAGQMYHFRQGGTSGLTFLEGAGVTINSIQGFGNYTDLPGSVVTLYYAGSDVWYLYGLLGVSVEEAS